MNKLVAIASTSLTLTLTYPSNAQNLQEAMQEIRESSDEPWAIKYVLFVAPEKLMREQKNHAQSINQEMAANKRLIYLNAKAFLTPSYQIGPIAATLLRFTPQAKILNAPPPLSQFTARRTKFNRMVFVKTKGTKDHHLYHFANWYEEDTKSPLLCISNGSEYSPEIDSRGTESGYFDCVEWARQLYKEGQPYIDITTYTDEGSFISHFMGWSRFTDPPKPVIGLNDGIWMCLHDCPNGERPGIINDIAAWSRKHGLPLPAKKTHED